MVCELSLSVGVCRQDGKFLCIAVMICGRMVNILKQADSFKLIFLIVKSCFEQLTT